MKNKFKNIILTILMLCMFSVQLYASEDTIEIDDIYELIDTIKYNPDANISIIKDLDFLEYTTKEVAYVLSDFTGTINGNNYAIKNINSPIFNNLNNAIVENLILDNVNINNNNVNGLLANSATTSIINNVHIIDSNAYSTSGNGLGGFIGNITDSTITNSSVSNTTIIGHQFVGGFVGYTNGTNNISNVTITAEVTGNGWSVGGFVGRNNGFLNISNSIIAPNFVPTGGTTAKGGLQGHSNGENLLTLTNVFIAPTSTNNAESKRIIGTGNISGTNVIEWADSALVKQDYSWLASEDTANINETFFKDTLNLTEDNFNMVDTSMDNLPFPKSFSMVNDYLTRQVSEPEFIKTVEELDTAIKASSMFDMNEDYQMLLMQREFVNNVSYDYLMKFAVLSESHSNFLKWLYNDYTNLYTYTMGGTPDYNNYQNELSVLKELYDVYKSDLELTTITEHGNVLGDVYRTMFFSIGKAYATPVRFWTAWDTVDAKVGDSNHPSTSDPVERYSVFKKLYENNLLGYQDEEENFIQSNLMFENLEVEEMRYVVSAHMDDASLEWLNWYIESDLAKTNHPKWNNSLESRRNPYTYMDYSYGFKYNDEYYADPDNYPMFDAKYNLSSFGLDNLVSESPKHYVIFNEAGICWGISKVGADIWNALGVPSNAVSQPGHLAYIYSSYDDDNDLMYWGNIGNAISNWATTGDGGPTAKADKFYIRMPLTWGDDSSATGYNASYLALSQEAINNFDTYTSSQMVLLLEKTYSDNNESLETIYKKAIELNSRDYDAWLKLTKLYANDMDKTNDELIEHLTKLSTALNNAPLPMFDLFNIIKPRLDGDALNLTRFNLMLEQNLNNDLNATIEDSLDYNMITQTANYLLGNTNNDIATFSFSGDLENTIILSEDVFGTNDVVWDYSLDGGKTWTQVESNQIELSQEEIAKVSVELDILVHIIGVNYNPENIFTIDILKAPILSNMHANDLENRVYKTDLPLEWYDEVNGEWTDILEDTRFIGDVSIDIRLKADGVTLAGDPTQYIFTLDNQPDNRKYLTINNINLVSSTAPYNENKSGLNMIDGYNGTNFYSTVAGDKEIVYSFDSPIKLSAIEYVPYGGNIGRILDMVIYGSVEGETYFELYRVENLENNTSIKAFEIDTPTEVQFVKFSVTRTNDGSLTGTMLNFYHDIGESIDLDQLINKIDEATTTLNSSDYNKTNAAKEAFKVEINNARDVLNNPNSTQSEVDNAVITLTGSISTFIDSKDAAFKNVLIDEINKAKETLNNITYDKEQSAKDALSLVIANATDILNNDDATQANVDEMVINLSNAITTYIESKDVVHKEELRDKITEATNTLNSTDYDKEQSAKDAFNLAITNATNVLDNVDALQSDVDSALEALTSAITTYIESKDVVRKEALNDKINEATEILNNPDISKEESAKNDFILAITNATNVFNNADALQSEVDDALATLILAVNTYINSTDLIDSELANVIENAKDTLNNDLYDKTQSAKDTLDAAINTAVSILENPDSTDEEIINAKETLTNAINAYISSKDVVYKEELTTKIDEAINVLNSEDYHKEQSAVDGLNQAITNATNVLNNEDALQSEVDSATAILAASITTYINSKDVVIKDDLTAKIEEAKATLNSSEYNKEQSAIDALNQTITNATNVLNDADATQSEVDNALAALTNSITTFIESNEVIEFEALETKIETAKNTLTSLASQKPQATENTLSTAINNAIDILNNATNQSEVDNAISALNTAIDNYINSDNIALDNSALKDLINNATTALNSDEYKKEQSAINALNTAISNALAVFNNKEATQVEVDLASSHLKQAIDTFINSPNLSVNTTNLSQKINDAINTLNNSSYNKVTSAKNELSTAIENAKNILNDSSSSQDLIDEAYKMLNDAVMKYILADNNVNEPTVDEVEKDEVKEDINEENVVEDKLNIEIESDIEFNIDNEELEYIFKDYSNIKLTIINQDLDTNENDKEIINAFISNNEENFNIISSYDIYFESIDANGNTYIEKLDEKIRITIDIPDGYDTNKKYAMLRLHNDEVTMLLDLDNNDKTITIETDCFSTYVLIEQEVVEEEASEDLDLDETNENTSDNSSSSSNMMYLVYLFALVIVIVVIVRVLKKR